MKGLGRELGRLGFTRGGQGKLFDENITAARMLDERNAPQDKPIAKSKQGMVVQIMTAMQKGEISTKQAKDLIERL